MLVPFCELTMATDGGQQVFVSPLQVCYVAATPNGNTKIVFDGTHNILVKDKISDVITGLGG